ncbi:MAG TPA: DUF4013 domain-containing protein [Anaerolineales bacterium]
MDIQKSFSFPFEDTEWINKLGLGAIITMIPVLNFAWSGYMVGIIRNVLDGAARPLPTWDDLGKKFTDGVILAAAGLIYALPMLLLIGIPITFLVFSGILSGNQNLEDISRVMAGLGSVVFFTLLCVVILYGLALSIIYPAILLMYAREGTFASCFQFRRILDLISKNSGPFLTLWGVSIVAGLVVGMMVSLATALVGWVPCIGWIAGMILTLGSGVYYTSIHAHLVGQFGRLAAEHTYPITARENPPAAV